MKQLTLENYEEEVENSELPVIIDFYADWCGPCKMMAPVFEELSGEYGGKLKFMKLDTQANEGLAMKFGIQGIPALVIVRKGEETGRIVGFKTKDALKEEIDGLL